MDKENIINLYTKGYSLEEISKCLKLGSWKVREVVKKAGIIRSHSEALRLAYKKGKHPNPTWIDNSGSNNPRWKGGQIKTNGYIKTWKPDHPFSDGKGYVCQHRLIMEKHLGRYLKPSEHIHHINGVPNDNTIGNLRLITRSEHTSIHRKNNRLDRWEKSETYQLIYEHKTDLVRLREKGLSYQKIADKLGTKMGTVRHAFNRKLNLAPSY